MTRKPKKISDQLREAILSAEITRYRIAQETGVSEAVLSRFVNGPSGLSLDSIDKIGERLGLKLTIRRKPKKRKGR